MSTSKAAVSRGGSRESSSVVIHLDPAREGFTAGISDLCGSWPPGMAVVNDVSGMVEL